jgi:hypothetical protein
MDIRNRRFDGESLQLDGQSYVDCVMSGCTLDYEGVGPIRLESCDIEDCQITYRGAAAMTIETLQTIAKSGPQGLDHVMRLFLPGANIDWGALAEAPPRARRRA